ncbi:acyl-CoA thioesterase [Kineococcus terrestris]|uniref:acyl-CoA thioesterase n=1 Tax=Kineococcus terrestris TaxID=2044856 RepID=UPI0034DAE0F5
MEPDDAAGPPLNFRTRKWVRPEDLNANGTLFGGSLLRWIDEEAAIYAILQLGNGQVVTKYISEIEFVSSAQQGDLVEMGLLATAFGRTSLTMRAEVRNMITRRSILTIERIVFVNLGPDGQPAPHGYSTITYDRDRIPRHMTGVAPGAPGAPGAVAGGGGGERS